MRQEPVVPRVAPLASILIALGCSNPAEGVTPAAVAPAAEVPAAPAGREHLTIDASSSSVGFTGSKITGSHDGTFAEISGTIELDPADLTASSARVTVQTASVRIEPERLRGHLLGADFFDVSAFPTAGFESTAVRAGGSGTIGGEPATHTITGNLTIRGVTRSLTFPAIVTVSADEVRARSELTILRHDFGIEYPGRPDDLIRNEVVLRFSLRAARR